MRTSRKTDFRSRDTVAKNNCSGIDIPQGLDLDPPSLSPYFLLTLFSFGQPISKQIYSLQTHTTHSSFLDDSCFFHICSHWSLPWVFFSGLCSAKYHSSGSRRVTWTPGLVSVRWRSWFPPFLFTTWGKNVSQWKLP